MGNFYILDRDEKAVGVLNNELPTACPFFDDVHTERLEHAFSTLEFSVPATYKEAALLETEGFIVYPNLDGDLELFRIKEITDSHKDGQLIKKVFCEAAYVSDLLGTIIEPVTLNSQTLEQAMTYILQGTGWELGKVEYDGVQDFEFKDYPTALAALHQIMDKFGAEIEFRVEFKGLRITKKYVNALTQRGTVTEKLFTYGIDLTDVERTEDTTNLVTALYGIGKSDSTGKELTFANYTPPADPKYEKNGKWVGSLEALERWGKNGKHIFGVFKDDKAQNPIELYNNTVKELDRLSKPQLTYKVGVILLEKLTGYEAHKVRLGDTIRIKDTVFNPPLVLDARVIERKTSICNPEKDSVVLGDYKPITITPIQALQQLQNTILQNQEKWNQAQYASGTGLHVIANGPKQSGDYYKFDASLTIQVTDNVHLGYTTIYTDTAGQTGTIELRDANDNVIQSKSVTLPNAGANRINLDFLLTPEVGTYKLWGSFSGNTFRATNGVAFPYDSGSFKVIGSSSQYGYWYHFFDMEIAGPGVKGAYGQELKLGDANNRFGTMTLLDSQGETAITIDSDHVGIDKLVVGQIISPSVVNYWNQDITIYVNPSTGSDDIELEDAIAGSRFKTVQRAIDILPKNNDAYVTIKLEGNTTEGININGFFGMGTIELDLQNYSVDGYIKASGNTNYIHIMNGTIYNKDTTYATVWMQRCMHSALDNLTVYSRNTASYNINVSDGGHCFINGCAGYGATTVVIRAAYGVFADVVNCKGQSQYGISAYHSSYVGGYGSYPDGTSQDIKETYGGKAAGTWNSTPDSGTPGTVPAAKTTTVWTSTGGNSYRSTVYVGWRSDNDVRQGEYQGNGLNWGFWFFGTGPSSTVTGKTISKIRVYLTRLSKGGNSAPQTVYIRYHTYTSQPSSAPVWGTNVSYAYKTATFSWGESKWVDITDTNFITAFQNGTAKGIGIYVSSGSPYMIFSPTAKLEITYS